MTILRLCIFLLLAAYAAVSSAQAVQEPTAAHRAAVVHFLKAMRAQELALLGMKMAVRNLQSEDPKYGQFMAEFFEDIRAEQILEKLVPVYAKYYSPENAEAIAVFFESTAGQKMIDTMLQGYKSGTKVTVEMAKFTPAEKQALDRFERTPAGRLLGNSQGKINAESAQVFRDWSREILRAKYSRVLAPMVREMEGGAAGTTADTTRPDAGGAKGSGFFSQFGVIIADAAKRSQESRGRFQSEMQQLAVETILAPQNLVSAAGIAQGKMKVARFHELLDQLLRTTEEILVDTRNRAAALDLPDKMKADFVKGLENGLVSAIDETIRFGEIERNLAELFQRTLEFSEARLGKTSYRDSTLVFHEQADVDTYNALVVQLKAEGEKEEALMKESLERRKKNLQQVTSQ